MELCKHGAVVNGQITFTASDPEHQAITCECCGVLLGIGNKAKRDEMGALCHTCSEPQEEKPEPIGIFVGEVEKAGESLG
jgi:hypothetical protein